MRTTTPAIDTRPLFFTCLSIVLACIGVAATFLLVIGCESALRYHVWTVLMVMTWCTCVLQTYRNHPVCRSICISRSCFSIMVK